jgi:hypothetical protein
LTISPLGCSAERASFPGQANPRAARPHTNESQQKDACGWAASAWRSAVIVSRLSHDVDYSAVDSLTPLIHVRA